MAEERRFVMLNPHLEVFVDPIPTPEPTPIPGGAIETDVGLSSWPAFVTREERLVFEAIGRYVGPQEPKSTSKGHVAAREPNNMEVTLALRPKPTQLRRKRKSEDEFGQERDGVESKKQKNDERKEMSGMEKLICEAWTAVLPHADAILRLIDIDENDGDFKRSIADWLREQDWAAGLSKIKAAWRLTPKDDEASVTATFYALLGHLEQVWLVIADMIDEYSSASWDLHEREEVDFRNLLRAKYWLDLAYDFGYDRNQVVLADKNLTAASETKELLHRKDHRAGRIVELLAPRSETPTKHELDERDYAARSVQEFDDKKAAVDELRRWLVWKEKFMVATAETEGSLLDSLQNAIVEKRFERYLDDFRFGRVDRGAHSDTELCAALLAKVEEWRGHGVDRPYDLT